MLICGWSLPAISKSIPLFRKLFILEIISSFYHYLFIFKVILYCSLYGFTTLESHFKLEEILLHSYWMIRLMVDGVADGHIFTYLLETLKCLMSVNKHLKQHCYLESVHFVKDSQ